MAFREWHGALVARILDGDGEAPSPQRRAAFDNEGLAEPLRTLIEKVGRQAKEITDEDFGRVRSSGASEDQLFELVVCAAVGEATRQYELALAALDVATGKA